MLSIRTIGAATVGAVAIGLSSITVFSQNAEAASLTWNLNDVILTGDSSPLTGSFDYDSDTNTYSNILITHPASGTISNAFPTTFTTFVAGNPTSLSLQNGPPNPDGDIGRHQLSLNFGSPLSNLGGIVSLSGTASFFTGLRTSPVTGTITATPAAIPTPALLPGLVGMGIAAFRKKRKNEQSQQVADAIEV